MSVLSKVYPASPAVAALGLMFGQNLVQTLFLAVPVDAVGTAWMNCTMALVVPAAALSLHAGLPRRYVRDELDRAEHSEALCADGHIDGHPPA